MNRTTAQRWGKSSRTSRKSCASTGRPVCALSCCYALSIWPPCAEILFDLYGLLKLTVVCSWYSSRGGSLCFRAGTRVLALYKSHAHTTHTLCRTHYSPSSKSNFVALSCIISLYQHTPTRQCNQTPVHSTNNRVPACFGLCAFQVFSTSLLVEACVCDPEAPSHEAESHSNHDGL